MVLDRVNDLIVVGKIEKEKWWLCYEKLFIITILEEFFSQQKQIPQPLFPLHKDITSKNMIYDSQDLGLRCMEVYHFRRNKNIDAATWKVDCKHVNYHEFIKITMSNIGCLSIIPTMHKFEAQWIVQLL